MSWLVRFSSASIFLQDSFIGANWIPGRLCDFAARVLGFPERVRLMASIGSSWRKSLKLDTEGH